MIFIKWIFPVSQIATEGFLKFLTRRVAKKFMSLRRVVRRVVKTLSLPRRVTSEGTLIIQVTSEGLLKFTKEGQ